MLTAAEKGGSEKRTQCPDEPELSNASFLTYLTTPGAGGRRERDWGWGGGERGETETSAHQRWKHKQVVILENNLAVLMK